MVSSLGAAVPLLDSFVICNRAPNCCDRLQKNLNWHVCLQIAPNCRDRLQTISNRRNRRPDFSGSFPTRHLDLAGDASSRPPVDSYPPTLQVCPRWVATAR
jgi:hypothetical protein